MLCKLNFTSFVHNAIILVSVSFRVRFPITLDQSNDSENVTFEKTKYFSGFVQLFVSKTLSTKKQVPFQFNTQQDVPEILQVVLVELKDYSTIAGNILAMCVGNSTTCDTSGCCNIDEVKLDIIRLPLAKSISLYLDRYLSSENLTGVNKWFCPACHALMNSTRETFVDSGSILVLQILHYDNFKGTVIKNNMRINCYSETLRLPI